MLSPQIASSLQCSPFLILIPLKCTADSALKLSKMSYKSIGTENLFIHVVDSDMEIQRKHELNRTFCLSVPSLPFQPIFSTGKLLSFKAASLPQCSLFFLCFHSWILCFPVTQNLFSRPVHTAQPDECPSAL